MDLSRDVCHSWRHVQSAHVWVCSLPFTLLSLNSVHSCCSVCPASPIATGSVVASYITWRQPRHASRDKSVQAFPCFSYCKRQKLGVEAWERGYIVPPCIRISWWHNLPRPNHHYHNFVCKSGLLPDSLSQKWACNVTSNSINDCWFKRLMDD